MPTDPQSFTWYEIWVEVYIHPSEQIFRQILADPKFHILRAFLWTFSSGALALFMVSLAFQADGKSLFILLTTAILVGMLLGPFLATLALVIISLPLVHGSGQFRTEQDKNRFVYCVAAVLAPALLAYGFLIAIGSLLAKLTLDLGLVLIILALLVTTYFFWLVKNGFNAATKQGPEIPRGIEAIHKSLFLNGAILALVILVYCTVYYVFLERLKVGSAFDFWFISLIALGFLVYVAIRVLSDLMERRPAKRLSEQGQVTDGTILYKWAGTWTTMRESSGWGGYETDTHHAYYIELEYSIFGNKHVIQRKITHDVYIRLTEGCPVKIRYLLDEPETVQLMRD
jgi:hypothetical protein